MERGQADATRSRTLKADFHVPRAAEADLPAVPSALARRAAFPARSRRTPSKNACTTPRRPELRAVVSAQHVRSVSPCRPIFLIRLANTFVSSPLELNAPTKTAA